MAVCQHADAMKHQPLTREALYALVWSKPSEQVAADLGITGTALAKICWRRHIPKPPRGYWARQQAGKKVRRPTLPAETKSRPAKKRFHATQPAALRQGLPSVRVVESTRQAYENCRTDIWGRAVPNYSSKALDLMVSREALERALQVMTLLIQAAREAGMRVTIAGGTLLTVQNEAVRLRLKEAVEVKAGLPMLPPTWDWGTPSQQKAQGTGHLLLQVRQSEVLGNKTWSDAKCHLEDQVEDIIAWCRQVPALAAAVRKRQAEEAERRLLEAEERRRIQRQIDEVRQALKRQRETEDACRQALRQDAADWEAAMRLRGYLDWLRNQKDIVLPQPFRDWAAQEVLTLDPVQSGRMEKLAGEVVGLVGFCTYPSA